MGDVEFRTLASALSTYCCPQATSSQAPMLLKNDGTSRRRQVSGSRGSLSCRAVMTSIRKAAAMETRTAIRVIGGISVTATFRNR